jgi:hypothetical protein
VPSHKPSRKQLDGMSLGQPSMCGFVPSFAAPHMPSPVFDCLSAAAHAIQTVLHAVAQQKPSTQKPVAHERHGELLQSDAPHAEPVGFGEVHTPDGAQ